MTCPSVCCSCLGNLAVIRRASSPARASFRAVMSLLAGAGARTASHPHCGLSNWPRQGSVKPEGQGWSVASLAPNGDISWFSGGCAVKTHHLNPCVRLVLHAVSGAEGLPWTLGPSTWAHWYYRPKTSLVGEYPTLLLIGPIVLSQVQGRNEPFIHSTKLY